MRKNGLLIRVVRSVISLILLFGYAYACGLLGHNRLGWGKKKKKTDQCIGPPEINNQKPFLYLRCNNEAIRL